MKSVVLQDHFNGRVHWLFRATLEESGDFTLNGEATGPKDESGDQNSYDWTVRVRKENVPALVGLLGTKVGEDVIDTVTRKWLENEGRGLEELIRESDMPSEIDTWGSPQF